LYVFLISIRSTCLAHLALLYLIILMFGEEYKLRTLHHAVLSSLLRLHHSWTKYIIHLTSKHFPEFSNSCNLCEISGSHGDECEDGCLLESCAMQSGRYW
jgi:hypothetical protein